MEPNSTSLLAHLVITQIWLQTVVRVSKHYNILVSRAQGRFKGCVGKALSPPSSQCFRAMLPMISSCPSWRFEYLICLRRLNRKASYFLCIAWRCRDTDGVGFMYFRANVRGRQFRVDYGTMVLQASTSVVFMVIHVSSILILSNTRTRAMLRKKSFYRPVMHS